MKALTIAAMYAQGLSAAPYGPILDESSRRDAEARCESATEGEIVVCAKVDHPTNQRLNQKPEVVEVEGLPRAEVKVGNAKVGLNAEQGNVGGFTSNRLMLGIKIPLGRRKADD